jgi:hypothetical protein
MHDFSKRALLEFVETSIAKGRINTNTGGGIRAACRKILEQVGVDEDVRGVDVKGAVIQYNNRHPGELSGNSLRVYESRVRGVIDNFVGSVSDPTGFKPQGKQNGVVPRKVIRRSKRQESATQVATAQKPEVDSHSGGVRVAATETSLAIPFPLRPTFLAQVVIPRDLTKDEAKRLAAFIDALAHDPPQ